MPQPNLPKPQGATRLHRGHTGQQQTPKNCAKLRKIADPNPPPPALCPLTSVAGGNVGCRDNGDEETPIPNCKRFGAVTVGHRGQAGGGCRSHMGTVAPPPPLCDILSDCCSFTGPWTVSCSSLRMLRRVAAFCLPLRPVLLLVSFPHSRSPVVGVLGLCWMWWGVSFACQRRPTVGILRLCWLLPGSFDCFCCPRASVHRQSIACLAVFLCV